jgi:hypothetical protein
VLLAGDLRMKTHDETIKMHGAARAAWLFVSVALLAQAGYMAWRFYLASLGPVHCDWRPGAAVGGLALVLLVAYLVRTTLRIHVDDETLRCGFGPFGLTIPRARIERAEAVSYSWATYGGWGVKGGFDGSLAYTVLGDGGRGVRVTYRNARGRRRTVLLSSRRPEDLANALTR